MTEKDKAKLASTEKRKAADQETEPLKDLKKVTWWKCNKPAFFNTLITFFLSLFPQKN